MRTSSYAHVETMTTMPRMVFHMKLCSMIRLLLRVHDDLAGPSARHPMPGVTDEGTGALSRLLPFPARGPDIGPLC